VTATKDATFEWKEIGGQVSLYNAKDEGYNENIGKDWKAYSRGCEDREKNSNPAVTSSLINKST
jgi:hypothetical protein